MLSALPRVVSPRSSESVYGAPFPYCLLPALPTYGEDAGL